MIRVLLAEDQAMVRGALAALLALETDLEVVADVGRGDEVVARALETRPDVALLDIEMPGLDGLAAAAQLRAAVPACRVLILTTFGRPGYLRRAMEAGATGFLLKDAPATELADAIRRVARGQRVVDPALALTALSEGANPLSEREREALALSATSGTIADIAASLGLSEGTVRNHLSAAIQKTGARNRAEAARIASDKGWLAPRPRAEASPAAGARAGPCAAFRADHPPRRSSRFERTCEACRVPPTTAAVAVARATLGRMRVPEAVTRRSIAVVGAGYVGLVSAVGFAAMGHAVELVETDPDRLDALRHGLVPFTEAGVQEALSAAIEFRERHDPDAAARHDRGHHPRLRRHADRQPWPCRHGRRRSGPGRARDPRHEADRRRAQHAPRRDVRAADPRRIRPRRAANSSRSRSSYGRAPRSPTSTRRTAW